jgi:CHAT domain-containing protein
MDKRNKKQMPELKKEWLNGSKIVLQDDDYPKDHAEINDWIISLIGKEARSDEKEYIVSCVYHSLSFDIPFAATKAIRGELLHIVRMKINDPTWARFPR